MKYEIVELEETSVVGLLKRTTNQNMQAVKDISCLWQTFFNDEVYASIKSKSNSNTIGLYTNYESDFTKPYDFIACCEVSKAEELQKPLVSHIIPKGKYAKFTTHGDIKQAVGALWQQIWQMNLNRIYTCDFEVYHNSDGNQTIDIYIAVK